jgi:hypothetical protein
MKQMSICKVFLLGAFLLVSMIAQAQDGKFQAIFLYKFIENINWPDGRKTLVIGIIVPGLELQFSGYNLTDAKDSNAAYDIHGDDLRREGINWMAKISYKL